MPHSMIIRQFDAIQITMSIYNFAVHFIQTIQKERKVSSCFILLVNIKINSGDEIKDLVHLFKHYKLKGYEFWKNQYKIKERFQI